MSLRNQAKLSTFSKQDQTKWLQLKFAVEFIFSTLVVLGKKMQTHKCSFFHIARSFLETLLFQF